MIIDPNSPNLFVHPTVYPDYKNHYTYEQLKNFNQNRKDDTLIPRIIPIISTYIRDLLSPIGGEYKVVGYRPAYDSLHLFGDFFLHTEDDDTKTMLRLMGLHGFTHPVNRVYRERLLFSINSHPEGIFEI